MALEAEKRIPDITLDDNEFKDGDILHGADLNKVTSVLKAGVNENYKDLKESDTVSNEHILDEVRHITGQERDRWNNTYTKEELYTKEEVYNKSEVYNKNETYPKENLYTKEETYSKSETYPKENLYTKNEVYSKSETYPKENLYTKNEVYTKEEVYTKGETYSKNDVYTKDNVYTKSEVDRQINDRITAIGSADMQKAVYDTNSNGIVDNSERLGGQLPSYYATKTEVDTKLEGKADKTDVSELRSDVSELQDKSYEIYKDEPTLETNGSLIRNMIIYGKSVQDGTPTPDNPIEIQSVVNPKVTVCGKNLLNIKNLKEVTNAQNLIIGDTSFSFKNEVQNATSMIDMLIYLKSGKYFISGKFESSDSKTGGFGVQNLKRDYIVNESGSGLNKSFNIDTDGYYYISFYISYGSEAGTVMTYSNVQLEKGSVATEYEPYKGQSATLPYTLNAIPVESGGNVTINGQHYIADYVDIERKKLFKYLAKVDVSGTFEQASGNVNYRTKNQYTDRMIYNDSITNLKCSHFKNGSVGIGEYCRWASQSTYYFGIKTDRTLDEINALTDLYIMYPLATPTEIDLRDEEVAQFKALQTYVPTSSIIASSDVLSPKVEFNYNFGKGIDDLYRSDIDIKSDISILQSDTSTLQTNVSTINTRLNNLSFVTLTQSEYDALEVKDDNTIYFITEG